MLNEIENIVFEGKNVAHSIAKLQYDEATKKLIIVVTPDNETEYNKVFRAYVFDGVANFKYDLDTDGKYEDWPRSIVGIDYYPKKVLDSWNTILNCVDIEFSFFSTGLPRPLSEGTI